MNGYTQYVCPKCKSENVRVIVERTNKPYDFCGGIFGYFCVGPLGLLCGFCGAEDHEQTTLICNHCGAHFRK